VSATAPVSWAARLEHVREVTLRGEADADFWRARLAPLGHVPAERDGCAAMTIVAADAAFKGLRFREVSVSVEVSPPAFAGPSVGYASPASFLLCAFSSRWLFALAERRLFGAPYAHAAVTVREALPAAIQVVQDGIEVLHASIGARVDAGPRSPTREGPEGWEGRVYLPPPRAGASIASSFFVARLQGIARAYPFVDGDAFALRPRAGDDALAAVVASGFAPREWLVRPDAEHAKSRTCRADRARLQAG